MNEIYKKCADKYIQLMERVIIFIALTEFTFYFIINKTTPSFISSMNDYLYSYMIIPTSINIFLYSISRIILKNNKISFVLKKWLILISIWLTCFNIAFTHHYHSITIMFICIPILISIIFNDRNTTDITVCMAIASLAILEICDAGGLLKHANDSYGTDILISIAATIFIRICCSVLLLYTKLSSAEINYRSEKQISLERQLSRDAMTCLYNHSAFLYFLNQEVTKAKKNNTILSLAVMDIDNFKKVNDTYGHDNGDKVIIRLAECLLKHSTDNEYACRYGGEEFSIIFTNKTPEQAEIVMQKIMTEFRNQKYEGIDRKLTISVGVAGLDRVKDTHDTLFTKADSLLYNAKNTGKNCCRLKAIEITDENRTIKEPDSRDIGWVEKPDQAQNKNKEPAVNNEPSEKEYTIIKRGSSTLRK